MEIIRHIYINTSTDRYELRLYDTCERDRRGQTILAYSFGRAGQAPLFEGEDFAGSPLCADDSDETICGLLTFLTLQPGGTDSDYFNNYTETQMEWAESYDCESLACDVSIYEEELREIPISANLANLFEDVE